MKNPERRLSEVISKHEMSLLAKRSNWCALGSLVFTWSIIVSAFALVILWPNPLVFIGAAFLLAGRQLSLAVLTHECAHTTQFTSRKANDLIGAWVYGAPMNIPLNAYRDYHFKHHRYAGTDQDPDLKLVQHYPVSPDSLRRKFTRDISGRTGLRDTFYRIKTFELSRDYRWPLFHILLLGILITLGEAWSYSLWWVAELFIFPLIFRIRNIGEHGVALDRSSSDQRCNTHTTLASWWERLLLAPNRVSYHLEHHLIANIPNYNLPVLHELLVTRGYYEGFDCTTKGYFNMLKRAIQPQADDGLPAGV